MFERSSTSQERDATDNLRSKRTASAQGLNVTTEGRANSGGKKWFLERNSMSMIDLKTKTKAQNILQSSGLFVHSLTPLKLNLTLLHSFVCKIWRKCMIKTHNCILAQKG